jgi:hypothetical protein
MLTIDKSELKIGAVLSGAVLSIVFVVAMALMMTKPTELEAQTAVNSGRVTVATTATVIYTTPRRGATVMLCNRHTTPIFIGPSTVTTANGFEVLNGDCVSLQPYPRSIVYGIVAAATARVDYFEGQYPR